MSRKLRYDLLNSIVFGVTILGVNVNTLYPELLSTQQTIWSSVALTILYIFILRNRAESEYTFNEFSKSYYKFFEKWYSKGGELILYSNDLEWLDSSLEKRKKNGADKVVTALKRKRGKLHLYLSRHPYESGDKVAAELIEGEAKYHPIRDGIMTAHRMSIRFDSGINKIIVRDTDSDGEKIKIIETSEKKDPVLFNLAKDLIENCEDMKS